jgi:hypothetical protein
VPAARATAPNRARSIHLVAWCAASSSMASVRDPPHPPSAPSPPLRRGRRVSYSGIAREAESTVSQSRVSQPTASQSTASQSTASQSTASPKTVVDVVAEDQAAGAGTDEVAADDEGLREPAGMGLCCIREANSPLRAAAQEALEERLVRRDGDIRMFRAARRLPSRLGSG